MAASPDQIVKRGKQEYVADELLQEAGDSLLMKLGEAANRLSRLGVLAPDGVEWALAVAMMLSRMPTVCRPRHFPAAHTRALI